MLFRRKFFNLLLLVGIVLSSCNVFNSKQDFVVLDKERRPNIVFILTDDLDAKLNTIDYMKNLQELLIARGTSVDDFLVSTPVCCPSRVSILRGQYVHSHQVYDNVLPDGGFYKSKESKLDQSTLGVWLQGAGYRTMMIGKYLNGYPYPDDRAYFPPGWTEWYSPAKKNAYDGYDYVLNETGTLVDYPPKEIYYFTDVMSQKSVDFIERSAKDETPFFMYISSFAPHAPATPARRHLDLFPDVTIPITPSFNEEDITDKVGAMRLNPRFTEENIADLTEHYRTRILSMQAVDEMIADLVDALERTNQLENTYIVFTSDNGYHIGQHRLMAGKTTFYEEDIVVPFVVRGPGIPVGHTLEGFLAGNVDIAPTIAEWAGVQPPAFVDGRSIAAILAGSPAPEDWRNGYVLEIYHADDVNIDGVMNPVLMSSTGALIDRIQSARAEGRNLYGIRTLEYLYVEHGDGGLEMYDLLADPYQLENIANSADPKVIQSFSMWLESFVKCNGSACRQIDRGVEYIP